MTKQQIEAWAIRVIERVKAKQPVEDTLVELKSEWPVDTQKAARRIAGHANAAHGEAILWLIGVDEQSGPVAFSQVDPATWIPSLRSNFEGLSPEITHLNIPYDGITVAALLIETERAPFVVKNPTHGQPSGGPVAFEVPWRDGTSVRSARRADLISILAPTQKLPAIEILNAELLLEERTAPEHKFSDMAWHWKLLVDVYISPRDGEKLVIPFHRCSAKLNVADQPEALILSISHNSLVSEESLTIKATTTEVIVEGPGKLSLIATANSRAMSMILDAQQHVLLELKPVGTELSAVIDTMLPRNASFTRRKEAGLNINEAWRWAGNKA